MREVISLCNKNNCWNRVLVVHLLVLGQLHELQGSGIKNPSLGVKVEVALGQIMQNSLKIYVTKKNAKHFGLYLSCYQMLMTVLLHGSLKCNWGLNNCNLQKNGFMVMGEKHSYMTGTNYIIQVSLQRILCQNENVDGCASWKNKHKHTLL